MTRIAPDEIKPGLVAHLDPDRLVKLGNCLTNAHAGKEVEGKHYFLVLETTEAVALAVPLYSNQATKSHEIISKELKSGMKLKWQEKDSFFFPGQQWKIPFPDFCQASDSEESTALDRRRYAESDERKMARILELSNSWPCKFRELRPGLSPDAEGGNRGATAPSASGKRLAFPAPVASPHPVSLLPVHRVTSLRPQTWKLRGSQRRSPVLAAHRCPASSARDSTDLVVKQGRL